MLSTTFIVCLIERFVCESSLLRINESWFLENMQILQTANYRKILCDRTIKKHFCANCKLYCTQWTRVDAKCCVFAELSSMNRNFVLIRMCTFEWLYEKFCFFDIEIDQFNDENMFFYEKTSLRLSKWICRKKYLRCFRCLNRFSSFRLTFCQIFNKNNDRTNCKNSHEFHRQRRVECCFSNHDHL